MNAVASPEPVVSAWVDETVPDPSCSVIVQASPACTVVGSVTCEVVHTTDEASPESGVPVIVAVPAGLTPLNSTERVNPPASVIVTESPDGVAPGISPASAVAIELRVSVLVTRRS